MIKKLIDISVNAVAEDNLNKISSIYNKVFSSILINCNLYLLFNYNCQYSIHIYIYCYVFTNSEMNYFLSLQEKFSVATLA